MDQRDTPPDMGSDPAVAEWGPVECARVLEDWVTIWQSEMAGLMVDREVQEMLLRAGTLWAPQARAVAGMLAPVLPATADERAPGRAGTDAAAGSATVDAALDGRDAQGRRDGVTERLLERVAELERRIGCPLPAGTAARI